MSRLFLLSASVLLLISISGCSIFSFKIKASRSSDIPELSLTKSFFNSKPIATFYSVSPQMLSQEKVHKFVQSIPAEIEKSADALISLTKDQQQHSKAMHWKKLANESVQQILKQSNSEAILLDSWIYIRQMDAYFSSEVGKYSFGRNQYIAVGTIKNLYSKISRIAQNLLTEYEYNQMKSFVSDYYSPFTASLAYKTAYNRWLVRDPENSEFISSTLNNTHSSQERNASNTNNYLEGNQKEGLFNTERFLLDSWNKLTNQNASSPNTNEDKILPRDILGNIVSLASNVQGNPIISENVKSLAIEMAGSLTPLKETKGQEEKAQASQTEEQENAGAIEPTEKKENDIPVGSPSMDESGNHSGDVQNIVERLMDKLWNDVSIFFPSVAVYLFLLIALIFVVPFFLGYFIGKKRQDPNFTIISSDESRKALH